MTEPTSGSTGVPAPVLAKSVKYLRSRGRPVVARELQDYSEEVGCDLADCRNVIESTLDADDGLRRFIEDWDSIEGNWPPRTPSEREALQSRLPEGISAQAPTNFIIGQLRALSDRLAASLEISDRICRYGCVLDQEYSDLSQGYDAPFQELKQDLFNRVLHQNLRARRVFVRLAAASGLLVDREAIVRELAERASIRRPDAEDFIRTSLEALPQLREFPHANRQEPLYMWLPSPVLGTNLDMRLRRGPTGKLRAASYVVDRYVRGASRIALDAGSSALFVVLDMLAKRVRIATVVTNNVAALPYLRWLPGTDVLLTGGEYDVDQGALAKDAERSAPFARGSAEFQLAVLGANSFDWEKTGSLGITAEAQAKVKKAYIAKTSGPIVFLCNHSDTLYDSAASLTRIANILKDRKERSARYRVVCGTDLCPDVLTALKRDKRYRLKEIPYEGGIVHEIALR